MFSIVSNKAKKRNFPKHVHFWPSDTQTYICILGGKKCLFFGKFGTLSFLVTFVLRFPLLPYHQLVFKFDTGIWMYKSNISIHQQVFLCCISLEANAQNFRKMLEASKIASCSSHYKCRCNKLFNMLMCFTPVLLYCPKPCCKFSFNGFLPSTVPYWN